MSDRTTSAPKYLCPQQLSVLAFNTTGAPYHLSNTPLTIVSSSCSTSLAGIWPELGEGWPHTVCTHHYTCGLFSLWEDRSISLAHVFIVFFCLLPNKAAQSSKKPICLCGNVTWLQLQFEFGGIRSVLNLTPSSSGECALSRIPGDSPKKPSQNSHDGVYQQRPSRLLYSSCGAF